MTPQIIQRRRACQFQD